MNLDKLLPAQITCAGVEETRRGRLVLYAVFVASATTLCASSLLFFTAHFETSFWILLTSLLHIGVFGLMWITGSTKTAARAFMLLVFGVIVMNFGSTDGFSVLATMALPLAASALLGTVGAVCWLVVGVGWAVYFGPVVFRPEQIPLSLGLASGIMTLVVGVAAIIIEYARSRAVEESQQQRRKLESHRSRLHKFAESTFPGYAVTSSSGIDYVSSGFSSLLGYSEQALRGKYALDFIHPDDLVVMSKAVQDLPASGFRQEIRLRHNNGDWVWLEIYGIPLGESDEDDRWIFAARDIHDERQGRERLLQAQRLEGLGVLAAGIAHDFNNLLSVVIGRAEVLAPDEDRDQILLAATQAAELTESLMAFGRGASKLTQEISVARVIHQLEPMFRSLLGRDVVFRIDEPTHDPSVVLAGGQLDQILLNLVTNAKEAMGTSGQLLFSVGCREIDEFAAKQLDVSPGNFVCLSVEDNGVGMSDEVLQHAFEPFYSTKPVHEGSGLGLAGAYGIVRGAGGAIELNSTLGRGTQVSLYLPQGKSAKDSFSQGDVDLEKTFSGQSCLLVEDELNVRALLEKHLGYLGFSVRSAENGEEALKLCRDEMPDVVVSDVMMPGIRGTDLAKRLKQMDAQLPILLISGYGGEQVVRAISEGAKVNAGEPIHFLAKPFRLPDLQSKLAELVPG